MEPENQPILSFEDALLAIDTVADSFTVDAWIPSMQKYVSFKEIDAKQQKKMLSTAMNSSVYNTIFIKNFYDILKNNYIDKNNEKELNNFTIFDKYSIALALKSKISNEIKVVFNEKENISQNFDVNEIISKFKGLNTPKIENISIKHGENLINIDISLPTIEKEVQFEEQIHKKEKKVDDIKNDNDIQTIIADAFVGEISKYVNNIVINDIDLNYNQYDFTKKIKIIEKLPSGIIQKILSIVSSWKSIIDDILTVKTTVDGVEYKKTISVDSILFLS